MDYKSRILAHFGATLAVIFLMVYFGILGPMEEMSRMKKQIETEKVDMEKNYLRGKNLRKLSESLKVVEPQLAKLDEVFIKKEGALDFITSLELTAENSGIEQRINLAGSSVGRTAAKTKTSSETIPVQLSSSGSFSKQMQYLSALEALSYYINVKTLEISNPSYRGAGLSAVDGVESGVSDSQVGIQILADTYWQN